jgi:hypothetical protein
MLFESNQIVVAGDDEVRASSPGGGQHPIVGRLAANRRSSFVGLTVSARLESATIKGNSSAASSNLTRNFSRCSRSRISEVMRVWDLASNRGLPSSKPVKLVEWCAIQVSNL